MQGKIVKYTGEQLFISVPFTDTELLTRQRVTGCEVILSDGRTISPQQRRYIYAMLRDIGMYSGHEVEFLKDYFKSEYVALTGGEWFSLANCSVTQANKLIDIIIQFCVEWSIPTKNDLAEFAPDVSRYVYYCLKNKVCCITRQKAELHHVEHVGIGRKRKEIIHEGMKVMPLCRKLHANVHLIGQSAFENKYHIHGIPLTKELCRIWNVKTR